MEFLDINEAAKLLRISSRSLRYYLHRPGGPPYVRLDRKILLKKEDLEAWIAARTVDIGSIVNQALHQVGL